MAQVLCRQTPEKCSKGMKKKKMSSRGAFIIKPGMVLPEPVRYVVCWFMALLT